MNLFANMVLCIFVDNTCESRIIQAILSTMHVWTKYHYSGLCAWTYQYGKLLTGLQTVSVLHFHDQLTSQSVFVLGNFKMLSLSAHLPTLQQYVTCPTHILLWQRRGCIQGRMQSTHWENRP
jgi:hypothetical protein